MEKLRTMARALHTAAAHMDSQAAAEYCGDLADRFTEAAIKGQTVDEMGGIAKDDVELVIYALGLYHLGYPTGSYLEDVA